MALTPRQRTALILIDGKRGLAEVLQSGATPDDIEKLFELQLVTHAAPAASVPSPRPAPQDRYAVAYPIAARLTASLGLRGVRLNIAVEAATCYEELVAVSARIRDAVGADRFAPLATALGEG